MTERTDEAPIPAGSDVPPSRDEPARERREADRRRTDRQRVDWRLALTVAAGIAMGLLLAGVIGSAVTRLQGLLVTLVVSLFLSFAMEPAVQWMGQRGMRRGPATLIVFLVAIILLVGFVAAMAPLVAGQVRNLVEAGPSVVDDLASQAEQLPGEAGAAVAAWLAEQAEMAPRRIPQIASTLGRGLLGVGTTVLGVVIQLLTMALVTYYLVADGPRLRRTLSSRLSPAKQKEFLEVWELSIAKTGGYVYSRLLTAVASAVFHIAVFTLIGLDYPVALGVWVGIVSSLIPVVGTYIAGALPLVIALASEPLDALWVLAAIVVYQQVENYLVVPKITEATMELHPAVAFVSVLIGAALLGAPGALLALPATAVATALASAYGERHEVMEHGLTVERNRKAR